MGLRLKNDRAHAPLRSFSYSELSYPDAVIDTTNLDWGRISSDSPRGGGAVHQRTLPSWVTFSTSSRPAAGFDTVREVFLGAGATCLTRRRWNGAPGREPRGAREQYRVFLPRLDLDPGEEPDLIFVLGVTDAPEAIPAVFNRFRQEEEVWAAFKALQDDWNGYLANFKVETPDAATNAMLNFWNPVQCRTTLYWSRFVSAYESGLGRGMGTRDSAQDTLGTVHAVSGRVKANLNMLWKLQFQDGHTWHQFFPLTGEGGAGLAAEFPDWPQWFSDDPLWLVMAVCAYLRETGDFSYLDEPIAYAEAAAEDTVWGHMLRAVQFTQDHRGPHGLPRSGFSDWDDTQNLDHGSGKAETVWGGMQFCRALLDLAELCETLGKTAEAQGLRSQKAEMAGAVKPGRLGRGLVCARL